MYKGRKNRWLRIAAVALAGMVTAQAAVLPAQAAAAGASGTEAPAQAGAPSAGTPDNQAAGNPSAGAPDNQGAGNPSAGTPDNQGAGNPAAGTPTTPPAGETAGAGSGTQGTQPDAGAGEGSGAGTAQPGTGDTPQAPPVAPPAGGTTDGKTEGAGGSTTGNTGADSGAGKTETPSQPAASQAERDSAVAELNGLLGQYKGSAAYSQISAEVISAVREIQKGTKTSAELANYVASEKQIIQIIAEAAKNSASGSSNTGSSSGSSQNSSSSSSSTASYINDDQRAAADAEMVHYRDSLIAREKPEQYIKDELESILYSGIYYIAYSEKMTESQMWDYVAKIKGEMDAAIVKSGEVTTTSEFLTLADNWKTPTVSYGQSVSIVLPLINLGQEELTDLLVEPVVSNDVNKWPFKPDSTGYTQNFNEIPGCATKLYDEAFFNRRELTYTFTAREDVLTGYYPLTFQVWYSRDGIRVSEPDEVTVYVYCQGKPGSGRIGMSEQTNVSQPRIIVTGFETQPAEIFAGDTFTLTIHVKNTSADTAVNNVLFDLQAVEGGTENSNGTVTNSYAAFLPTSGSSSIYFGQMAAGASNDLVMEMQAKADLSQKPYVVTVKMKYDTEFKADLTDEAKVSVPIKQISKFDSSTPEINPTAIAVGEQANVMFQIYNTGKTTLYNVQVKFEADSVSGGDTFIGNLAPGATGNVDTMVSGSAPTMDDGVVKAVITYEDDTGKQTRTEKEITLFVSDMPTDDGMGDMMPMEEPEQGMNPMLKIALVAAAILALVVVVLIILLTLRKKRKAARELKEDLADLQDDERDDER